MVLFFLCLCVSSRFVYCSPGFFLPFSVSPFYQLYDSLTYIFVSSCQSFFFSCLSPLLCTLNFVPACSPLFESSRQCFCIRMYLFVCVGMYMCSPASFSRCPNIITCLFQCETVSLCHCFSVSVFLFVTTSLFLCLCVTVSVCLSVSVFLCLSITLSLCLCVSVSLSHWVTASMYHYVTASLCHCATFPLDHCATVPLCHCAAVSLCHSVSLSLCCSVILPHCHCVALSLYHSIFLLTCLIVSLSLCLSIFQTLSLSHSLTLAYCFLVSVSLLLRLSFWLSIYLFSFIDSFLFYTFFLILLLFPVRFWQFLICLSFNSFIPSDISRTFNLNLKACVKIKVCIHFAKKFIFQICRNNYVIFDWKFALFDKQKLFS